MPGSSDHNGPLPGDYDKLVVFVGKYANWKRLDAVLGAAAKYESALGLWDVVYFLCWIFRLFLIFRFFSFKF